MHNAQVWAERLREIREGRGLSRNDLAILAGVTVTTIWRIEGGSIEPRPKSRHKLLVALGYTDEHEFLHTRWQDRPWPPAHTNGRAGSLSGATHGTSSSAVAEFIEDIRPPGTHLLPIYAWAAAGDPLHAESAPDPVDRDYPPLGKERLVGPRGMGIKVKGMSMANRNIVDDDIVYINPDMPPRYGRPVAARVWNDEYDGAMVIKLYRGHNDLWSDGREEGLRQFACHRVEIIGPAVWVTRGFPPG